MPKVSIGDIGIEVEANPISAIAKYFRGALALRPAADGLQTLRRIADKPLREVGLDVLRFGLTIERTVDVGAGFPEWMIEANSSAGLSFFSQSGQQVLSGQMFGDGSALSVLPGQAYVAFHLEARLTSSISSALSEIAFGFTAGTRLMAGIYQTYDSATTVREAVSRTLAEFQIPGDWEDLLGMPDGCAVTVNGGGRLSFAVSGQFACSANPLAITIPAVDVDITASAGASVFMNAEVAIETEYELRAFRIDRKTLLFGVYKKHGSSLIVNVGARAGVDVTVGPFELASRLLSAATGSADVDPEFLARAGLSSDQIERIASTVQSAINRKLEGSLSNAFSQLRSEEAAFLFQIDLEGVDQAARSNIRRALDGDLRGMTSGQPMAGITTLRTIATETWIKSVDFRINLAGIFNYVSVTELLRQDCVLFEPVTGEIVITDQATATRIRASVLHTEADLEKLRKLLYEAFLITATYCGTWLVRSGPALTARHSYFELNGRTNRQIMKDYLDVPLALGLAISEEDRQLLQGELASGRSALYAETVYDPPAMRGLFFDATGRLHPQDAYVNAGLTALSLLVREGDEQDFRRALADSALWNAMESAGSGANAHLVMQRRLPALPYISREVIYSDYRTIAFWAESMASLGRKMAQIDEFFVKNPGGVDRDDKRLNKLRQELRDRLADVAAKTKEKFGDPWGLVAAHIVGGGRSIASARITTSAATISLGRPPALTAGS